MTDSRLRDLERRWRGSGSVQDEAAYLVERIRVGDLDQERLALAAYLAHPAARAVLADEYATPEDLIEWVSGLSQWGKECFVRAGLSSAQSIINFWAERYPEDLRPQQALETVINWIINPCGQTVDAAARAARVAAWATVTADPARVTCAAADVAALVATTVARAAADAAVDANAADAAARAARATSTHQVRTAISSDLISWALGYRDPVREQYEALQAKANQ